MKRELKLLDALGNIDDQWIEESLIIPIKKSRLPRVLATVASFAIVFGLAGYAVQHLGGASSGDGAPGSDNLSQFSAYLGPTLPLTIETSNANITATRHIDYDFAGDQRSQNDLFYAQVTDDYTLTNNSDTTQDCMLYYPVATTFNQILADGLPSISVDGTPIESILSVTSFGDRADNTIEYSLLDFDSYQAMLDSDIVSQVTTSNPPSEIPIVVYEFSDFSDHIEEYPAATVAIEYKPIANDSILTYGCTGGWNYEGESQGRSFDVPDSNSTDKILFISLDGELDFDLQTYQDGGCDPNQVIDTPDMTVTKRHTTLDQVFTDIIVDMGETDDTAMKALLLSEMCSLFDLSRSEPLNSNQFSDVGMIEDLYMFTSASDLVAYQAFPITLDAGSSIEVSTTQTKQASYNYYGAGQGDHNAYGYDFASTLGSCLNFTTLTASIENLQNAIILDQNIGFDLAKNRISVELDPTTDRYYFTIAPTEE